MKFKITCLLLYLISFYSLAQADSVRMAHRQKDSSHLEFNIPIFSTGGDDAESGMDQQDVSPLLQASRDVFTQFAGFQFGAGYYRMRGYTAENQVVMVNGINVNSPETGFSTWSAWGGLNDVTRFTETRFGNVSNRYGFSGVGGYTNIDSRASSFKKGTKLSYANSNRVYRNRYMLTHATGIKPGGWALAFSASNRSGNEVYIPGTYFNASSFYFSADKRINDKHAFSFTGFAAPSEQGRAMAAQKEVFELAGTNYYNNAWGYQSGKVRNSNVSKVQRPVLLLSHIFSIGKDARLTTSISYNFGRSCISGLTYYKAQSPRPDYYRYLPSFYYQQHDTLKGDMVYNHWISDERNRQISWDRLIAMNQANLYTVPSQAGQGGMSNETRARYILENRVEDVKNTVFNCVYNRRHKKLFLSSGINANIYKSRKYKEVEDLLGATFWLDVDQFAEGLGVEEFYQLNDIDNPNKKIYRGDKFGYDYAIRVKRAELWGQVEYALSKIELYVGASVSGHSIWREGYVANGKFPTSSKGMEPHSDFISSGIKGGLTYKISGRHFITANASCLSRAPEANHLFVAAEVRNDLVSGTVQEQVASADVNYLIRHPSLKLRFTYYNTQVNNQVWLRTYWHDAYNTLVNMVMKGVNENHQGFELGLEKTVAASHIIQSAVGLGQFLYTSNPVLEAWQYNNSRSLFSEREVYLKHYRLGGSPQTVAGVGYRYNGKRFFFAGVYFNYFDQIYVEPNPDRRTAEATGKYQEDESAIVASIIAQERLPRYFTVNANAGRSFRIMRKYFLNINLSINNVLNNKNIVLRGFEQLRWDNTNIDKFPNKYYYMPGTTYMAMINFNF